jgi:phage terminase Nu1 subunit (DNA packaging protein)
VGERRTRAEIIEFSKELFARSAQLKEESEKLIAQGLVAGRPAVQLRRANYKYARLWPPHAADLSDGTLQQEIEKRQGAVLNSWKEIAAYVKRGVRTLQRWERELGLPVRRSRQRRHSPVMAFKSELDQWLSNLGTAAPSSQTAVTVWQLPALERRLQQLQAQTEIVRGQIRRINSRGVETAENPGSDHNGTPAPRKSGTFGAL